MDHVDQAIRLVVKRYRVPDRIINKYCTLYLRTGDMEESNARLLDTSQY